MNANFLQTSCSHDRHRLGGAEKHMSAIFILRYMGFRDEIIY